MLFLPEEICNAWANRDGAAVLTTVDANGIPNSVYVGAVELYKKSQIVIADNYFKKTKKNILSGSKAAILFITKDRKAYQIKGSLNYETKGDIFEFMKSWNPEKHPGHAAAILKMEEIYSGAEKLV